VKRATIASREDKRSGYTPNALREESGHKKKIGG